MSDVPRNYQSFPDDSLGIRNVLGKKFHAIVSGTTHGAHQPIVEVLKDKGWTEVTSPGECDYLLVFCPVVSRVGTDISEALDNIPAGKPAILVVMHHTFDCHHVIAPSSRLVENPDVLLTLDCLFHENKLLSCNLNKEMWDEVYNFLGVSQYSLCPISSRCVMNTQMLIVVGIVALLVSAIIVIICFGAMHKLYL